MRCPRGEKWPTESFKSYIDSGAEVQTYETITFVCPAGHSFKLKRAVATKMFTAEQAQRIIAAAGKLKRIVTQSKSFEEIERELKKLEEGKPK
jgi:hypothetical protein